MIFVIRDCCLGFILLAIRFRVLMLLKYAGFGVLCWKNFEKNAGLEESRL